MVEQADCVFAMDFQNKAELLALYPEAKDKFLCSARMPKVRGNIAKFQIRISAIWRRPGIAHGSCKPAFRTC